ncbi:TonB-dependent receptor [Eilatimonas milleporae]|uniref:Iron complex outermembrane receptor protein n=1 Tax=Eilatimonas milleporae TaxID=911205 RepID=A0A3M0BST7_9PROT|nr:TonB-dependent receptor [Eilatimonas milleporae]RMB00611.1 iron complex outermembrane receptor protein [Eilatimonas milleporae]
MFGLKTTLTASASITALMTALSLGATQPAAAQESTQETNGADGAQSMDEDSGAFAIDEILITARRTQESLKDAPITVSAFSEDTIQKAGIQRPTDFAQLVPNVLMLDTAEAGDTQVIIRGVINARDVDPSYALVVDGVLQPDPYALNRDLVAIQQIEVVKGPVSSLYGRNAVGGAILITTKRPSNDLEARATAEIGNGGHMRMSGFVSGPLVQDQLYANLAASYTDRDGFFDNEFLGGQVDFYEETRLRGRVLWEPSSDVSLDVSAEYADIQGSAINFNFQTAFFPNIQPQFADGINVNDTSLAFAPNVESINPAERLNLIAKLEWDLGFADLFIAGGYNQNDNALGSDFIINTAFGFEGVGADGNANNDFGLVGYTPAPGTIAFQERNGESMTFEARLSGDIGEKLEWSVGTYVADIERSVFVSLQEDSNNGEISLINPGPQTFNVTEDQLTEADVLSFYGQLFYDITPRLELALSGRWDSEDRTATNLLDSNFAGLPTLAGFDGLVREESFDRFQPRVSLRWTATDTVTFFASYGEGFRAGGFNAPGTRATVLAFDFAALDPDSVNIFDTYDEEVVKGWEAGFKSQLFDGAVQFNGTVFLTKTENSQVFEFTPVTSTRARTNIDETELKGFEAEAIWAANDYLTLNAAFGYTDATVERFDANPFAEGNAVPSVPETTLNVGGQFNYPVQDDLELISRVDYQRIGETPWDINGGSGAVTVRDPVDLVNVRLGFQKDWWSITAWARNLFDEEYNVENIISYTQTPGPDTPAQALLNFAHRGLPRTYGIELTVRY